MPNPFAKLKVIIKTVNGTVLEQVGAVMWLEPFLMNDGFSKKDNPYISEYSWMREEMKKGKHPVYDGIVVIDAQSYTLLECRMDS